MKLVTIVVVCDKREFVTPRGFDIPGVEVIFSRISANDMVQAILDGSLNIKHKDLLLIISVDLPRSLLAGFLSKSGRNTKLAVGLVTSDDESFDTLDMNLVDKGAMLVKRDLSNVPQLVRARLDAQPRPVIVIVCTPSTRELAKKALSENAYLSGAELVIVDNQRDVEDTLRKYLGVIKSGFFFLFAFRPIGDDIITPALAKVGLSKDDVKRL